MFGLLLEMFGLLMKCLGFSCCTSRVPAPARYCRLIILQVRLGFLGLLGLLIVIATRPGFSVLGLLELLGLPLGEG
jgi:hypothetical protein